MMALPAELQQCIDDHDLETICPTDFIRLVWLWIEHFLALLGEPIPHASENHLFDYAEVEEAHRRLHNEMLGDPPPTITEQHQYHPRALATRMVTDLITHRKATNPLYIQPNLALLDADTDEPSTTPDLPARKAFWLGWGIN
jgi:hypothetical protein